MAEGRIRRRPWKEPMGQRQAAGALAALIAAAVLSLASSPRSSTETTQAPTAEDPALRAAGDIAACNSNGDKETAAILDAEPGRIASLGDHAYESGSAQEFADCYEPSWGRHKDRTR